MAISFENGVSTITHEELRQTLSIADFDGKMPEAAPIMHYELVDRLLELANKTGIKTELGPLCIKEAYCNKIKDSNNDPKNYRVNRIAGKIYFDLHGTVGNDSLRPAIAFVYVYDGSLKGIQLAFGEQVFACDNNTIFGKFTYSTNKSLYSRTPFEQGFQLLSTVIEKTEKIHNVMISRLNELNQIEITKSVIDEMIGDLYTKAVLRNDGVKLIAPLNVTEIGKMVRYGFDRNPINQTSGRIITAWDIMNWGTEVLKPERTDMTNLLNDTASFNDYIASRFLTK